MDRSAESLAQDHSDQGLHPVKKGEVSTGLIRLFVLFGALLIQNIAYLTLQDAIGAPINTPQGSFNFWFSILVSGILVRVVVGIGPIAALFWSKERIIGRLSKKKWLDKFRDKV